jgi:hypothetical protein
LAARTHFVPINRCSISSCFYVAVAFVRFAVYFDVFAAYSKNAVNDDGLGGMDM